MYSLLSIRSNDIVDRLVLESKGKHIFVFRNVYSLTQ